MNNVWVICDLHLWSKEYDHRHPFKTDIEIRKWIDGFAQCTHDSDVILFLGDMGDPEVMEFQKLKDFLSNISGYKILCKGNHDTEDDTYYEDVGFDKVCEVAVLYSIVFSHIPVKLLPDQLNIHAHLHYEKDSRLNYQYINAFDFYQDHKPMLLDDILEQAAVRLPEAKENPVLEKYQTYAGPKEYQNILDISDMIQLFPMDEAVKINTFSLQELNKVQTPDELQKWMRRFIHYANYSVLKSPEQVLSSGSGSCHDQVAFEFPRLVKMDLNPKILFLITYKEGENVGGMTHSLCYWVDEDNGSCTWFENAWQGAQGIHKFKSLDDLKIDIKNRYARMPQSQNFPEIEFRSTSIKNFKPGINLDTLVKSVFKADSVNESTGNIASINAIDDDYINSCIAVEIVDKRGMESIALNHIRDRVTMVLKHFHPILKDTYNDQILIDNSALEIPDGYKKPLFFTSPAYPGEDINIFHVLQRDRIPHDIDYTNLVSSSVCYGIILQVMKMTWKKELDPMLAAAISFCIWNYGISDLIGTFNPNWKQWFAKSGEVLIEKCRSIVQIEKDYGIGGIYLLTTGQLDLDDCMLSEAVDKMAQPLDEILFEDPTDTELWEQDDNYNPAHKKKELQADGLGDIKNEASTKFVNDKGEKIPTVCPKCGSKVGVFLRGEPVFLCTNKKCKKYFGTVPFDLNESVRDDAKQGKVLNIYMILDHTKDDELIHAGKPFGGDITAAVRNFKDQYCRSDEDPRMRIEKDPPEIAYVHMPEPGYYDFRYSDQFPDSWWCTDDVNLRMVGTIKFDKDWSWKIIENEATTNFTNSNGEHVPNYCPDCGSRISMFSRGEYVYLCTNEDCERCFGKVPYIEECLQESNSDALDESTKSTLDKDFKPKEKINLSSLKKIRITEDIINKYKKEYPILRHVRCKDTKEYICDGYMWFDNQDKLVCHVGSCEYNDDHTKWIVSLEILPEYKGHGLSKQILDFATKTMGCKYLSVNKNNELAKHIYDQYGFRTYQSDKVMYYMTIDPNQKTITEAVAETHQLDREQQEKVAAKYGLRNPGHDLTPAEERVNEERDKRKEYLKKARKIKKQKAFIRKLKSKIPGIKNEDSAVDNDAQSYENPDLDVGPFTSEVRFYNRIHEYPNEAVSILSNADIQFKSIQEFIDYFNTHQNLPEPFIGESYKFELEDKNLHFNTNMNLTEAASPNEKLYPVYIMLQHSGTLLANMIKGVTQSHFSHSSISFDSSMRNMYSFGRKSDTNPFIGAFKKEDIHSKFFTDRTIPYALYVVPCTQEQVKLMKKRLDYFIQNSTKFKYDFTGLLKNYLGIADNPEYKWFCSRFVADIINAGSPQEHPYVVEPSLMKPEDFQYTNFAIYVTGGYLNSYDSNFVDKVTNRILRTERIRRAKEAATNKEYLENLPIAESVFDLDPFDPYQELVTNYQLGMLQESAVDDFLQYLQSFKIKFEKDGSIRLTRREYDQLDQHFKQSLRSIRAFEKADNLEGVKGELCKIYYMIELINQYYLSPKVKSSDRVKADLKKQMMDLRSVLMNVFKQHLKYVTVREPQFNFQTYYDHSKYGKDIEIPKAVLSDVGKALITKL